MFRIFIFTVCIFIHSVTSARPVSYPEAWTFMTMNNANRYSTHLHYSPTAKYSVGWKAEYWREQHYSLQTVQLNYLLKRWNKRSSQANLYLKSGLGFAYSDFSQFNSKTTLAGFTGIAADWETRRYFLSYENRITQAGTITDNFRQSARIGIAPYIEDFGSLHTWLMLEVIHEPESNKPITVTALARLFKGPALLETGISHRGDPLFNFVYRF